MEKFKFIVDKNGEIVKNDLPEFQEILAIAIKNKAKEISTDAELSEVVREERGSPNFQLQISSTGEEEKEYSVEYTWSV